MMTEQSAHSFALWLMKDQPQLFIALAKASGVPVNQTLGSFASVFSAIGTGIGTAARSVGSFLTSSAGLTTLTTLGGAYLSTQAQKKAVQLQLEQAKAAQAAAPIQTQYNPSTGAHEVIYTTVNGQQIPVTAQNEKQLFNYGAGGVSSIMTQSWFPFAIVGAVGLVIFLIARRK